MVYAFRSCYDDDAGHPIQRLEANFHIGRDAIGHSRTCLGQRIFVDGVAGDSRTMDRYPTTPATLQLTFTTLLFGFLWAVTYSA